MPSPTSNLNRLSPKAIINIRQLEDGPVRSKQIQTACKKLGTSDTTLLEGEKRDLFHVSPKGRAGNHRYGPFEVSLTEKGRKHFHWSNENLGVQARIVSYLFDYPEVSSEDAIRDIATALGFTRVQVKNTVWLLASKGTVRTEVETVSRGSRTVKVALNESLLKNKAKPRPKKMVLPAPTEPSPKPEEQTGRGFMGVIEHLIEKEVQRRVETELKSRNNGDRDFIKDLLDDFANNGDVAPLKLLSDIHEYVSS